MIAHLCPHSFAVMLSSREYYILESVGACEVQLVRSGDAKLGIDLMFEVKGAPRALTGGDRQTITLGPGQFSATFPLQYDFTMNTTPPTFHGLQVLELGIELVSGEAHLSCARAKLKIVNEQRYPLNGPSPYSEVDKTLTLLQPYLIAQFKSRGIKAWKTAACFVYIAFHSSFVNIVIYSLVVDFIKDGLTLHKADSHLKYLAGYVACAYIISHFIEQRCKVVQQDLRGRSGTRKDLRNWLVAKYLDLDQPAREAYKMASGAAVNPTNEMNWLGTIVYDVETSVNDCWFSVFLLTRDLSAIIFKIISVLFIYIALDTKVFLSEKSSSSKVVFLSLVPFIIAASLVAVLIKVRSAPARMLARDRQQAEEGWIKVCANGLINSRLIAAVDGQQATKKMFKTVYELFYYKHRTHRFYEQNTVLLVDWTFNITWILLLVGGPYLVYYESASATTFITMLKIYEKVRKLFMNIIQTIS